MTGSSDVGSAELIPVPMGVAQHENPSGDERPGEWLSMRMKTASGMLCCGNAEVREIHVVNPIIETKGGPSYAV